MNTRVFTKSKMVFIILLLAALVIIAKYLAPGTKGIIYKYTLPNNCAQQYYSPVEEIPPEKLTNPDLILLGAREEAKKGVRYDASYMVIDYPGGDVPEDRGACTDVVVRAFRNAGYDLQVLIHEDMMENFNVYPQNWGLKAPDTNIDHRRVPNQVCFFKRHGKELTTKVQGHLDEWKWGDVVYWRFLNGDEHCGIISDRKNNDGIPLVIHNAGITREEDCLLRWKITGHYRYTP